MPFHSGKSPKARKIAGSLLATFPNASPPLVWKFDLEKNHSFTCTLQGEEGDWELGVASPRGEFYSVARFLSRDDAQDAFTRVQCALLKKERKLGGVWGAISLVLLILFLVMLLFVPFHRNENSMIGSASPEGMLNAINSMNPVKARDGYAIPADQILIPPQ